MNEKQLEDALHTWPLEKVPGGFSDSVMAQIKPQQSPTQMSVEHRLKFRLTWMDLALGMFFSLLPVIGFISFISLPRKFILFVQYQLLVLRFPAYEPVLLFTVLGGAAVLLLLTLVVSMRYIFPRQVSQY